MEPLEATAQGLCGWYMQWSELLILRGIGARPRGGGGGFNATVSYLLTFK